MKKFKLSYYSVITDIINEEELEPKRIIYSTRSSKVLTIKDKTYGHIINGELEKLDNNDLFNLTDALLIVPEDEDEFNVILNENSSGLKDRKILYHVMQPGANCQLGCHYCGQKHTKDSLSENLYETIINRIEGKIITKEFDYENLDFTWYGGEPLMALKQIRELTPMLKSLAKKHNLSYTADMITNGLSLKENLFVELVEKLNILSFQITIDGTAEIHDKRRMTKTGENTFSLIMKNIVNCVNNTIYKEKKCSIGIRINIDKTNQENVNILLEHLETLNILDKVNVQFAQIVDWGKNGASANSLNDNDFAENEIGWMLKLIQSGGKTSDFIPVRVNAACMVEDKNSEVFDAFGNVFPCYELPYTPIYEDSEWLIGNLKNPDKEFKTDNSLRNWVDHVKEATVSDCKSCKFYPVCGGGCPKSWLEGKPACPSFKFNIEDRLILQYISNSSSIKELL
jgi:uncharacterized protein